MRIVWTLRRTRPRVWRQRLFPARERAERRERGFKRVIVGLTAVGVAGLLGGTAIGRYAVGALGFRLKWAAQGTVGLPPSRADVDAEARLARVESIAWTKRVYRGYFAHETTPAWRRALTTAGLSPETVLLRWANGNGAVVFSPRVFEADDSGRSYRMRPNTTAFWTRDHVLSKDLGSFLLFPDDPAVRAAVVEAGNAIVPDSFQTTNSWGCRGPEPDCGAVVRGLVLGDSFMQGVFINDESTPPAQLQRVLHDALGTSVSILNTGHIGYSPEQYYYTLREYFDRFRPRFVLVSVCANDFGVPHAVLTGRDDGSEGKYWINEIQQFCRTRGVPCFLCPLPFEEQVVLRRDEGHYPGPIADGLNLNSFFYINPVEAFVDEHLRLLAEAGGRRKGALPSPLYNGHMHDGHFSPRGSALWARVVGRRIILLRDRLPPRDRQG